MIMALPEMRMFLEDFYSFLEFQLFYLNLV